MQQRQISGILDLRHLGSCYICRIPAGACSWQHVVNSLAHSYSEAPSVSGRSILSLSGICQPNIISIDQILEVAYCPAKMAFSVNRTLFGLEADGRIITPFIILAARKHRALPVALPLRTDTD